MKNLKDFNQFITESTSREHRGRLKDLGLAPDHGLRGETINYFSEDLTEIFKLCPNLESVWVPSSSNSHHAINIDSSTKQWKEWDHAMPKEEALAQVINELTHISTHTEKILGQITTFYIWGVDMPGTPIGFRLEKELEEFGGSGKYQDIDALALIKFLKQNPELAEKVRSLNVSTDSIADRDFAAAMSRGDFGSLD